MCRKNFKYYPLALIILLAVGSCKRVIDLDLANESGKLVIEANVTDTAGQQVILSRNVQFTSPNVYPAVTGAAVLIKDADGNQYPLTEGPAGTYSNPFTGESGKSYSLSVAIDGKTYTAQSTMPQAVKLDSITDKNDIFDASNGKKIITVHFQDPINETNQYRFVLFVNRIQVKSIFAFDDEFVNGKHVDLDLPQPDTDIHVGDTVMVQMQCIDKPVYKYWYTLSQQQINNPGGQVAPANPPTNILPITLGYFSAHTTQTTTLIVK